MKKKRKLKQDAKHLHCNWDFKNKIEVGSNTVPPSPTPYIVFSFLPLVYVEEQDY